MDELTAYEILGVAETASAEEITAAYERRRRDFHPDLNWGDKEWVQRLYENYVKVSAYRRAYDHDLALKRADKARVEREEQAAAQSPPARDESTPNTPTPHAQSRRPPAPRARRDDPKPLREPYRYEAPKRRASRDPYAEYFDDPPLSADEVFAYIGAGIMGFAWWFFLTEGFADFKLWWNPVAWIPVLWLVIAILWPSAD